MEIIPSLTTYGFLTSQKHLFHLQYFHKAFFPISSLPHPISTPLPTTHKRPPHSPLLHDLHTPLFPSPSFQPSSFVKFHFKKSWLPFAVPESTPPNRPFRNSHRPHQYQTSHPPSRYRNRLHRLFQPRSTPSNPRQRPTKRRRLICSSCGRGNGR